MDYFWDNPAGGWVEHGVTAQGRLGSFAPAGVDVPRHRLADASRLAGARSGACRCTQQYPASFAYCPECGQALEVPRDLDQQWFGRAFDPRLPRHVPLGLPVAVFGAPAAPLRLAAPPNAEANFASAAFGHSATSLLALAPRRGVLQYWDPCAAQWLLMEGPPGLAFTASFHGWLPLKGNKLLLPTDAGLAVLEVDLLRESYRLDCLPGAAPAAAPGRFGEGVHAPLVTEGGIRFADGPVVAAPQSAYQAPFSYDGQLWWLHAGGCLRFSPAAGGSWQPWPDGWRPCLGLCGPTPARDGQLWLCGHDGGAYTFLELGTANPRRVGVDGLRAGWANFVFRRGHEVRGEPWDEPDVDDPYQHDSLVIPLLRAFNSDRARPAGLVLRLPGHAGMSDGLDMAADATIEWIGPTNRVLERCTRLPEPLALKAFLHDGAVWLHHPSWSQLRGWRVAA